jgi:hypothetical protein
MNTTRLLKRIASIAALVVAGCGGSGGSGGNAPGALTLHITDAAVDAADHVFVQFHGVEIQGAGQLITLLYCQDPSDPTKTVVRQGACTTPAAPKQLDLLALSGGQADFLLNGFMLPSGHYDWVRLLVDTGGTLDTYIVVQGVNYGLTIPSGMQTGLKVNRGFDVPAGGAADFTIDFDLRKSVVLSAIGYILRPTLRMVDNVLVGAISGTVNATLVPSGCTPAVYVFAGAGVTPDDIDGIAPDPVTVASVKLANGVYSYRAAFLEAGSYTLAYTCDAAADDPMVNDTLVFGSPVTVVVAAGANTVQNF